PTEAVSPSASLLKSLGVLLQLGAALLRIAGGERTDDVFVLAVLGDAAAQTLAARHILVQLLMAGSVHEAFGSDFGLTASHALPRAARNVCGSPHTGDGHRCAGRLGVDGGEAF